MKDTGGPAFPVVELSRQTGDVCDQHFGITLRDYFAAKAMQGIVSVLQSGIRPADINLMCTDAYNIADAMLAERNK